MVKYINIGKGFLVLANGDIINIINKMGTLDRTDRREIYISPNTFESTERYPWLFSNKSD